MKGGSYVIDKTFWDRLRVKALLDSYMDSFIMYAKVLQDEYSLTDTHIMGVIKMVDENKLSRLSALWEKVVPIVPSFSNVPDGDYIADIKEMVLGDAKKTGRLQVVTTLEIVDGEFAGKTVKRFDGVEEETGMGYFKNLCEVIGLDLPADLHVWQEHMDAFVGDEARIDLYDITTKTTKGKEGQEYSNVYLNGIADVTRGEDTGVVDEVQQAGVGEVVDEQPAEVVEEVAAQQQEIVVPQRRPAARRTATPAPVAAVAAPPVRQPAPVRNIASATKATTQPIRRGVAAPAPVAATTTPVRRVASLRR